MRKDAVLLIFVKNPEPGKVKTRLAETVGRKKALHIYKKLLAHTRKITRPLDVDRHVWYSRYIDDQDEWDPNIFSKKIQQGDNLGERMKGAFAEAFRTGRRKVVIIGSDCAELTTECIQQGFDSLGGHDVVIGPSADGGYYLLGMNAFHPGLFDGIMWSTPGVLAQTIAKVEQKKLGLHLLPMLNDVDDEADWQKVKDRF